MTRNILKHLPPEYYKFKFDFYKRNCDNCTYYELMEDYKKYGFCHNYHENTAVILKKWFKYHVNDCPNYQKFIEFQRYLIQRIPFLSVPYPVRERRIKLEDWSKKQRIFYIYLL